MHRMAGVGTHPAIREIDRSDVRSSGRSIYKSLIEGSIVVIRRAPELFALRDLMAETLRTTAGPRASEELLAWCNEARTPSGRTVAHVANLLLEMRRRFVLPALMADLCADLDFPGPVVLECGAPRFNVPEAVEQEFRSSSDILNPEVLEPGKNDPIFDHMLVKRHYPHRDIGRPQLAFQANAWCALQALEADESNLIFFPDAFRDIRHDRSYYAFADDRDPSKWGLGTPVLVPLQLGDIALFSGDLFHSSPRDTGANLRLSWEMRIVGRCHDDRGWYRLGHLGFANFLPRTDQETAAAAIERGKHLWRSASNLPGSLRSHFDEEGKALTAMHVVNWLVTNPDPGERTLAEAVEVMKRLPFSEDRFLWPHFLAQQRYPTLGIDRDIEEHVIQSSANYYWLLVYGGCALASDRKSLAERAFARAREAARQTKSDTSTNPVDYAHALSEGKSWLMPVIYEITPEDVDEVVRLYKEGRVTRGCRGDSVELVPGFPFVKGMFKPYYPYVQFHPPKASDGSALRRSLNNGAISRLLTRFARGTAESRFPPRSLQVGENWLPF
jgi:hypothetical protein